MHAQKKNPGNFFSDLKNHVYVQVRWPREWLRHACMDKSIFASRVCALFTCCLQKRFAVCVFAMYHCTDT